MKRHECNEDGDNSRPPLFSQHMATQPARRRVSKLRLTICSQFLERNNCRFSINFQNRLSITAWISTEGIQLLIFKIIANFSKLVRSTAILKRVARDSQRFPSILKLRSKFSKSNLVQRCLVVVRGFKHYG